MFTSSTRTLLPATRTFPEQRQPNNCHCQTRLIRNAKVDFNSKSGIEVQWKNDANRRVQFDPTIDWRLETHKAEQGHLRRLAELQLKRNFEKMKQNGDVMEKMGRVNRWKEIYLYMNYCDIELLVDEYCNDIRRPGKSLVARMFHLLFINAGIPTETMQEQGFDSVTDDEKARLSTCFVALRKHFQRIFGNSNAMIWGFNYTNVNVWNGLKSRDKQALYFIHCLSPVFHFAEKDAKQRQVYNVLYGDVVSFEAYLFQEDTSNGTARKDLREQVYAYFSSLVNMMGTDLDHIFAALRRTDDEVVQDSCDWHCCYDDEYDLPPLKVPYDSLSKQSRLVLFVISSMPAFRTYLAAAAQQQPQDCLESSPCAELLMQSQFLGLSLAGTSESSNAVDSKPKSTASNVDVHSQDDIPY